MKIAYNIPPTNTTASHHTYYESCIACICTEVLNQESRTPAKTVCTESAVWCQSLLHLTLNLFWVFITVSIVWLSQGITSKQNIGVETESQWWAPAHLCAYTATFPIFDFPIKSLRHLIISPPHSWPSRLHIYSGDNIHIINSTCAYPFLIFWLSTTLFWPVERYLLDWRGRSPEGGNTYDSLS